MPTCFSPSRKGRAMFHGFSTGESVPRLIGTAMKPCMSCSNITVRFLSEDPAVPHPTIDRQCILGSNLPHVPKDAEPANQLCAVLSPVLYSFGEKFLTELHYRNLSVAALFFAVLLGPYFLIRYEKLSRNGQTASISGITPGPLGARPAPKPEPFSPARLQPAGGIVAAMETQMAAVERSPKVLASVTFSTALLHREYCGLPSRIWPSSLGTFALSQRTARYLTR